MALLRYLAGFSCGNPRGTTRKLYLWNCLSLIKGMQLGKRYSLNEYGQKQHLHGKNQKINSN